MKLRILLLLVSMTALWSLGHAQTTADFENLFPGDNQYIANAGPSGVFTSGHVSIVNNYFEDGMYWSGFTISSTTDTLTQGFMNQYSSISGHGVEESKTYATAYAFDPAKAYTIDEAQGGTVKGFYVNNSTYAYYSMLEGDGIAKRFGGITGADPDYFLLTIEGYGNGVLKPEKVEFYLADFRSDDPEKDYIVKDWTWVDLEQLGDVDSLLFSLSSTDNNPTYGMNTPAYFCIDNVVTSDVSAHIEESLLHRVVAYPIPVRDRFKVDLEGLDVDALKLFNRKGQCIETRLEVGNQEFFDVSLFNREVYYLQIISATGERTIKIPVTK